MHEQLQKLLSCRSARDWRGVVRHGEALLNAGYESTVDEHGLIEAYVAQAYRHLFDRAKAQQMIVLARSKVHHRSTAEAYVLVQGSAIHADRGAISTAVAWGEEFLNHVPEYPEAARPWAAGALHNLAHAFRSVGEPNRALTYCQQAFHRYSEFDAGMAAYMKVHEAQIYCDMRDTASASAALQYVVEHAVPREHAADCLSVKATLAYLVGDYDTALENAIRVLAHPVGQRSYDLNDAEMYSLIGSVLYARGHDAEGRRYLKRAEERFEMAGRLDLAKLAIRFGGGRA